MDNQWSFSFHKTIYAQIVEKLQKKIVSGEFSPGDRLPSVRALAEEAGVNPNTMMRALAELESKNLLFTMRGNGKFITLDAEAINKIKYELAEELRMKFINNMRELGFEDEEITIYNKEKEMM